MYCRNTTKILQHKFLLFNLLLSLLLSFLSQTELSSNYELFMYFCFCFFFHSYGSFNCKNSTSLGFPESPVIFIHIITFSTYRKSFCTFICQVSLLTSSCQFSTNPSCSSLPCAYLMFILHLLIMLPHVSLGFLIRTSSDWSRGFSSCYHSKMGKHIAKSSSLTSSLFLHLQCLEWLSFHSYLALYTTI